MTAQLGDPGPAYGNYELGVDRNAAVLDMLADAEVEIVRLGKTAAVLKARVERLRARYDRFAWHVDQGAVDVGRATSLLLYAADVADDLADTSTHLDKALRDDRGRLETGDY